MRYNLACALTTNLNDPDRAIEVLEPYFRTTRGAAHIRHADVDPDLDPIRDDPRFRKLLSEAKHRLGIAEELQPPDLAAAAVPQRTKSTGFCDEPLFNCLRWILVKAQ